MSAHALQAFSTSTIPIRKICQERCRLPISVNLTFFH